MATTDEMVRLAQNMAARLGGVKRNDWQRWVNMARDMPLDAAISQAARLGEDRTLRPNIRFANRSIAGVMRESAAVLNRFTAQELAMTLGYVGQALLVADRAGAGRRGNAR